MLRIKAENFLQHTTDELFKKLEGDFIIYFSDGEYETNEREVIYSSFVWDYFRKYPKTPMLMRHHLRYLTGGGDPSAQILLKMVQNVYWSVYDAYRDDYENRRDLIDELSKLGYDIVNNAYCYLTKHLGAHVTSLNILDFISITRSEEVSAATLSAEPTEAGMVKLNGVLQDQLKNNPANKRNPLAVAIRTGISRLGQGLQCLGMRGFLTDVDSDIFRQPIMTGYIRGIRGLYESLIESRSAAKSLMNSTKPLQDSEYFSRRQQLVCQNVQNLHMGDCGSTRHLIWKIRGKGKGDGANPNGDLETLAGKYYLDDETGSYKVLRKSDTHLIGKTLMVRSIIAGCNHPDPNGVCEYCYGETALAFPEHTNLGQAACVTMTSILGQMILSTKHYDGSSVTENIVLRGLEKKYFTVGVGGSTYMLSDKLKGKTVKLHIRIEDCPGLVDTKLAEDLRIFNVSRVSEFSQVAIEVTDAEGVIEVTTLDVFVNARNSSMTHDLLAYARDNGYSIVDDKYRIDLTKWDHSKPLFVLPLSHFNVSMHQDEIAKLLEATAADMKKRNNDVSPEAMIVEFHDLVNSRLSINLSILEVIVYSSMIVDSAEGNYDLPKPWTKSGFGIMRNILKNRSLSALMAYQGHRDSFISPDSYLQRSRMDHILDAAIMPQETLTNKNYLMKR